MLTSLAPCSVLESRRYRNGKMGEGDGSQCNSPHSVILSRSCAGISSWPLSLASLLHALHSGKKICENCLLPQKHGFMNTNGVLPGDVTSHPADLKSESHNDKCWQRSEEGKLTSNWCWNWKIGHPLQKTMWQGLGKVNIERPCSPAILLLCVCVRERRWMSIPKCVHERSQL